MFIVKDKTSCQLTQIPVVYYAGATDTHTYERTFFGFEISSSFTRTKKETCVTKKSSHHRKVHLLMHCTHDDT